MPTRPASRSAVRARGHWSGSRATVAATSARDQSRTVQNVPMSLIPTRA